LKQHLDNLISSKKTVSILEKLLGDNEASEEIFVAMKDYFKLIDKMSEAHLLMEQCHKEIGGNIITKDLPVWQLAQLALFWKIIYWNGYFPRFRHCTYCDRKIEERDSYEFILSQGINCGCQSSEKTFPDSTKNNLKIDLSKNVIKLIKFLVAQPMKDVEKIKIVAGDFQDLKQFTKLILEQVVERRVEL
jgi:recombinational DNA repair protein (RecF pathway)